MKKIFKLVFMFMLLTTSLFAISACDEEVIDDPIEEKVTVSWWQGSNLLKEEEIVKGGKVVSWTPVVEGKTFTGWFSEASTTTAFDFTKPINEDTDIFAAFKSDEFVSDTNSYYLIGTGAADMGKAAWDHAKAMENLSMVKQDVEKANIYKITISMYAGDRFQICYGGTWDGQQGIGIMVGAEYCDGVNEYDNNEYTAADKKVAQVKDKDGNVVFVGSDEYNKGFEVWNIILAPEQDGKYEFTLTTYPNAKAYNTLEFKLIEKIEPLEATHEMALIGAFNEWKNDDTTIKLSESEDKSTWSGFITVTPDMFVDYGQEDKNTTAFKVFNHVDGIYHGDSAGENIFVGEGTWAVKYNVDDNSVVWEKCAYYIVGTLLDAEGNAVNYSVKDGVSPKLVLQEDGAYVCLFEAYDVTSKPDYSWMTDQNKVDSEGVPAIISIKVVFGSSLGIKDWYSAEGDDNWYLSSGNYMVVLADNAVTITKE